MSVLLHYAREPLSVEMLRRKDQPERISSYQKPAGFWVSVQGDDDWLSWCTAESFGIKPLAHQVKLADDHGCLWLTDALDIDVFTERYRVPGGYGYGIDWRRVASEHKGLIIAPYCWERRLHNFTDWYYGWDCASGCIFDPSAIASIRRVPELDPAEPELAMTAPPLGDGERA